MHKDSVTLSADLIIVFEPGRRRVMHRARQASVFSQHLRALGFEAVRLLDRKFRPCAVPGPGRGRCLVCSPPWRDAPPL